MVVAVVLLLLLVVVVVVGSEPTSSKVIFAFTNGRLAGTRAGLPWTQPDAESRRKTQDICPNAHFQIKV